MGILLEYLIDSWKKLWEKLIVSKVEYYFNWETLAGYLSS